MSSLNYTLQDQQRMAAAKNYFAWQYRLVSSAIGRRVIEVGCGMGNFTQLLLDREAVIAVDIDAGCLDTLRSHYAHYDNLRVFAGDVQDASFRQFSRFQPDSCVCLNVLEHVEDDRAALGHMGAAIEPGGVIVLLVPAFQSLYGPIDRNLGHCRRYTKASLRRLAQMGGLEIRKLRYMNVAGFFGWWTNAHIFRREAQSEKQIELFDRWIVPVESRIESLIPPPFGQSLFAVLARP